MHIRVTKRRCRALAAACARNKQIVGWLTSASLLVAAPASAATGAISEYRIPSEPAGAVSMVAGPDGALWFTELSANKIGRVTVDGEFSEFAIPTANSQPDEIDLGPDGNLWFAETAGNKIGRITPSGQITEFPVPTPASRPTVVAAGPDGNVWFSERGPVPPAGSTAANPGNKIGRVVIATGAVEEFDLPVTVPLAITPAPNNPRRRPLGMTAGSDGDIWFTEERMNQIARFDPGSCDPQITHTCDFTEYPLPNFQLRRQPFEISAGPDGNVWFTELAGNRIGRITPAGQIDEFALASGGPNTIRRGPDPNAARDCAFQRSVNADAFRARYGVFGTCVSQLATTGTLWFTETTGNRVAKITTDGEISEYAIPTGSSPIGIAAGPDDAVWFAENTGNNIGRLDVQRVGRPIDPASPATPRQDAESLDSPAEW